MFGQYQIEHDIIDPQISATEMIPASSNPGGFYIPSVMGLTQYLRTLIIFVQFPDDNYPTEDWVGWDLNTIPTSWMGTNIIDPNLTVNSTNNNLTHYYKVMSVNNFRITGDCYYATTPHTRKYYLKNHIKRGNINKEILRSLDGQINYALYDNWKKNGNYNQTWGQDGEVDMIIMVYRNIGNGLSDPVGAAIALDFGDDTYGAWTGVSSLGDTDIDTMHADGKVIDFNYYTIPSGITIMAGFNGLWYNRNIIVHELGHQFFGPGNHVIPGTWGMMAIHGGRSQMVNSYERQLLNWGTTLSYNFNPILPIILPDYLTSGISLSIPVPSSSGRYYLENHQRNIPLDNIDYSADGKGIYVLYQPYNGGGSTKFLNAQGKFQWSFFHRALHPTLNDTVSVMLRGKAKDSTSCFFDTDYISLGGINYGCIEAWRDTLNDVDRFVPKFWGDGLDMMKPGYVEVFNPYGNPKLVQGVSFLVINENNQLKICQYIEPGTVLNSPPSRPQNLKIHIVNRNPVLTWEAKTEPDVIGNATKRGKYKIYRGTAWMPNNLIAVPNINYSYIGYVNHPTTTYTDEDYTIEGGGNDKVFYKVTAVDTTNLESTKSEYDSVRYNWIIQKRNDYEQELSYTLSDNYPNPFNPNTTINYSIPNFEFVELKVFDILGREIEQLVGNYQHPGNYTVTFNADELTSGIYIYRLKTNSFLSTKKMVLLK